MDCTSQISCTLDLNTAQPLMMCCPPQVLVIDRQNGPADIFMEIVGKLAERDLCITTIFDPIEVEPFLKSLSFDLIVIGLDDSRPALMDLIPKIRSQYPNLPVLVIGDRSTTECIECIQNFGAREYIALPSRIADLKAVVRHLRESYFSVIQ